MTLLQTRHSNDSSRLSVETSILHSNAHNSDSRRSSQAFVASSLEAPWPFEVRNLRPWMSWLGKLAKSLFIFLFFSFLIYNYKMEHGKVSCDFVTMSQWCDGGSQMVMSQVTVTVGHMMRVTWGPWESKCIATVVRCISSREMSKNSIEFSLSNSEQRDSWLNSGHQTLDADNGPQFVACFTKELYCLLGIKLVSFIA